MEAIDPNIFRLTIFVLSIFVGYYVVWSVTPASVSYTHLTLPTSHLV